MSHAAKTTTSSPITRTTGTTTSTWTVTTTIAIFDDVDEDDDDDDDDDVDDVDDVADVLDQSLLVGGDNSHHHHRRRHPLHPPRRRRRRHPSDDLVDNPVDAAKSHWRSRRFGELDLDALKSINSAGVAGGTSTLPVSSVASANNSGTTTPLSSSGQRIIDS
jgi:hypothetical protein